MKTPAPFSITARSLAYLFLLAMVCVQVHAQMMMPAYLFPEASPAGRNFPRVMKAPDGTLVLTFGVRNGSYMRFRVALSSDNGVTWGQDHFVMETPTNAISLQRQTYVVMDNMRVLHALGAAYGAMNMLTLYYARSEDLGATWSTPKSIKNTADMRHMDFGGIAVDSSGNIYISYISEPTDTSDAYTHDYLVKSTDAGATWSSELQVDRFPVGGSCECCTQTIDISASGEIAVAFRSNIENQRDIHVARSNDGGQTFSTPVNIQTEPWMIGGCPATGPSIKYEASGDLHITWRDARIPAEPGTCFYAMLPNGSTTTPANVNLSSGFAEDSEYPYVSASYDGQRIGAVWESQAGVFLAYSDDGGATFRKDTLASEHNAYPNANLVMTPSGPLVLWQKRRGTVTDIAKFTYATTAVDDDVEFEDHQATTGDMYGTDGNAMFIYDVTGRLRADIGPGLNVIVTKHAHGVHQRVVYR